MTLKVKRKKKLKKEEERRGEEDRRVGECGSELRETEREETERKGRGKGEKIPGGWEHEYLRRGN